MISKRQVNEKWEQFVKNLKKETPVPFETTKDKLARIARLEKDPEEWFKYHFPNYAYAEPADFHEKATKRIIKNKKWYEVRPWARELAKSTRTMMEFLYLALVLKECRNLLLISHTQDNATDLLTPFRLNLEFNQRLINDYGVQKSLTKWEQGNFLTKSGISFRGIGSGQSPRGTKNEEVRPDFILFDDFDTDVACRNPNTMKKKWDWIEQAVIPTVSVSANFRIIFLGNIIGKDCCIKRAMVVADHAVIVNIRDENGKSNWSKNSEEDIDYLLSKISYASGQKEYFNNPITKGTVFDEMVWGKIPPLSKLQSVLCYGDPSPSNAENKKGSFKAVLSLAFHGGTLYIIDCRLAQANNYTFIKWFHELNEYTRGKVITYHYIENNGFQDPFYKQVLRPLMEQLNEKEVDDLYPLPDERAKPDKFTRIEGNLEPLHRVGKIVLNERHRNNPHMVALEEQFEAVEPTLAAHVDGPDAAEGGYWILKNKLREFAPIKVVKKKRSKAKHF